MLQHSPQPFLDLYERVLERMLFIVRIITVMVIIEHKYHEPGSALHIQAQLDLCSLLVLVLCNLHPAALAKFSDMMFVSCTVCVDRCDACDKTTTKGAVNLTAN